MRGPGRACVAGMLAALAVAQFAIPAAGAEPPDRHRFTATTWSSLGVGIWTVGLEGSGSHWIASPRGVPLWIVYGGNTARGNPLCDSGEDCDSNERGLFGGAGSLWCTNEARASGFCLGGSIGVAYRRVKVLSTIPHPIDDEVVGEVRGYLETGCAVRFRLGLRFQNDPPYRGGQCPRSGCGIRSILDFGLVIAL